MRAGPARRNPDVPLAAAGASTRPVPRCCGEAATGSAAIAISALVARYGLWAILVGAGLEGEAVVLTGGVLAHKGLLPFWGVAACAAVGSLVVDQFWFAAGRWSRDRAWVRRAMAKPAFARALGLLERHSTAFILGFRFIYGIRTVSPIAIGASNVPTRRFVGLNAVAAALWGPAITAAGYWLGRTLEPLFRRWHDGALPWLAAGGGALLAVVALWWWRQHRRRHLYPAADRA